MIPVEKNIGLFVNPLPGKEKARKMSVTIQQKLNAANIPFTVYDTIWPEQISAITDAWIIGGDGTLNYFVNKYRTPTLPLAIFPAGTGNDFSWKLYGKMPIDKLVKHVLEAGSRKVDAGICNEFIFMVGVGIGFEGAVLKSIKTVRFLGGHLGYLLAVIKTIFSFKESFFDIKMPSEKMADEFLLLIVNNSSRTGGGFMVAPNASVEDGLLDIVICKKMKLIKRLRSLPVIEKGKHLNLPFIIYRKKSAVVINCEKEIAAHLDGELITAKEFNFEILPGHFLFSY